MTQDQITIKGARLHNLKNISISIPKNKLVVFTGVSGSGKSTLALDILFNESQRQFMESLGMVTYALSKAPVDSISGLSPSISVDQHLTNHSPRSTVGTVTEVFTYLRVLFARIGHRPCPNCGQDIPPSYNMEESEPWVDDTAGSEPETTDDDLEKYPCPHCGYPVPEMVMGMFSFNKPAGACPTCTGLGTIYEANFDHLFDQEKSIEEEGAIAGWDIYYIQRGVETLRAAGRHYGFEFDTRLPIKKLGQVQRDILIYGVNSQQFRRHFPDKQPPDAVSRGYFEGVLTNLLRRHAEHAGDPSYLEKIEKYLYLSTCPDCEGTRLRPESRAVTVAGQNIVNVSRLPLEKVMEWVTSLKYAITPEEWQITEPVVIDLEERVRRLVEIGVGYLTLDRASPSLSAGEAQRLRLAVLLGSGLTGVLYVLDEPTIGLHARDNNRLVNMMRKLRDLGNTVLVIEHDLGLIASADYLVDFGPGAGRKGGWVIAEGTPDEVAANPESVTGAFLAGRESIPIPARRRSPNGKALTICGARANNLKNITARLPLGVLLAVTGVSGSGKSSLMFDILDRAARQRYYGASELPGEHDAIEGWENIDKIITIDQSAIGRSTRSNAATYTDAFTAIRQAFAATEDAKKLGLSPRHFSFNVPGGRCERCEGAGVLSVEMHFMPSVLVRCPTCKGRRFKREVLSVKYGGVDIAEVLDMSIDDALGIFKNISGASSRLALMSEVGLGYLQLGQPATTLSGGEAQRVKLAKELSRRGTGNTIYLLDEPSTGLHTADTAHLLHLLQRLVDAGNTVVVVEHNLDLIRCADWVIDLGPEGGEAGGEIIAQGTPEQIAQEPRSWTGKLLQPMLV